MKKYKQYWITKFEAFLKENNCYEEFDQKTKFYNKSLKDAITRCFNDDCVNDFVAFCFTWDSLKFDFWCDLDDKWREVCKNDL